MKLFNEMYRQVTEKMGFDINAGQNIDMSKSVENTISDTLDYIDKGNKGCCFHASVYLIKLLHDINIETELILTLEPTQLENGEVRNDMRASVLVCDNEKIFVANPIEDIEFFEKNEIEFGERKKYYKDSNTELIAIKDLICSKDAAHIDYEDFINRYGNGTAWTIGSLFFDGYEHTTFGNLMNKAKVIKVNKEINHNK